MAVHSFRLALIAVVALAAGLSVRAQAQPAAIVVDRYDDVVAADGGCTLREAMENAETPGTHADCESGSAGADTIRFEDAAEIEHGPMFPLVATEITIDGEAGDGERVTIVSDGSDRHFGVEEPGVLTLLSLDLDGGSSAFGGAIASEGSLTLRGVSITGASATFGGAVGHVGVLLVEDSAFTGNSAGGAGGAIVASTDAQTVIRSAQFEQNVANDAADPDNGGGAIAIGGTGPVTIEGSTFAGNDSGALGGAIFALGAMQFEVRDSTFDQNEANPSGAADLGGGAIAAGDGAEVTIAESAFTRNTSGEHGGAVVFVDAAAEVSSSTFTGNAARFGGAIAASNSQTAIGGSSFDGNEAEVEGGGLRAWEGGELHVTDSEFTGNEAMVGGGLQALMVETTNVERSTFEGNAGIGGGLHITAIAGAEATLTNVTVVDNGPPSAGALPDRAGGIFASGAVTVRNSTIVGNTAETAGGLEGLGPDTVLVENSILADNEPGNCLGAFDASGAGNFAWPAVDSCPGATAEDPLLGDLADNGGSTRTMALLPGSPAIDTIDADDCPDVDQRGVERPFGDGCDAGAFEWTTDDVADVTLEGSVDPEAVEPGGAVEFTVVLTTGPGPTYSDPVVDFVRPEEIVDRYEVTTPPGWACNVDFMCTADELGPDAELTFVLRMVIEDSAPVDAYEVAAVLSLNDAEVATAEATFQVDARAEFPFKSFVPYAARD